MNQPDPTRRMMLTGALAVAVSGLLVAVPSVAEAQHSRRRSRDHGRRRSRNQHSRRRSRDHGRRRSRRRRRDWDDEQCFFIGPVVFCEFD